MSKMSLIILFFSVKDIRFGEQLVIIYLLITSILELHILFSKIGPYCQLTLK